MRPPAPGLTAAEVFPICRLLPFPGRARPMAAIPPVAAKKRRAASTFGDLAASPDRPARSSAYRVHGDGAELEAETWEWDGERWTGGGSAGAGPLDTLGPSQTGGQIGNSYFAYGSAPGRQTITINFDGRLHQIPVSHHGVWAFIKTSISPGNPGYPTPTADKNMGTPPSCLSTHGVW